MGLNLMGAFGIMRTIDICFVSLLDTEPPRWIKHGKLLPLPETVLGRAVYAFDLVSSIRGRSWFQGTVWNWASPWMKRVPPPSYSSRLSFLLSNLKWLAAQYLIIDILDTLNHRYTWSPSNPTPITSLPFPEQLLCAFSLCLCTVFSITAPCLIYSSVFTLVGCPLDAWPSMFDRPLSASSLQDFWSNRWHEIFRRVFDRLSTGILYIPSSALSKDVRRVLRATVIFALSGAFHLGLIQHTVHSSNIRLNGSAATSTADPHLILSETKHIFLDPSTLKFFLSQPFGLFLERAVIVPIAANLAPRFKGLITRVWVWVWLLYSSRWWCDAWVHAGLWNMEETLVGWSPVRGILKGQWWLV
ncbi:membrane bound O-acyl transferase family-domain-containing protein [Cantharellus anzutake]|uniref:membrane bound O-acyl transferase family-domain-containing protein n=1 Tax=Cantharellus anzutake TaxID=1750568 RepID=UPI0019055EE7|nr:membrane bound O-acyl transferase family-domain-containing protein [Cantharellus anzutake]KAF8343143.1 membrane bound O-acyl transferase family-domain-containing protein [Cantharellus anzutake]